MKILALDIGGSKLMSALVSISQDRVEIERTARRSLAEHGTTGELLDLIDDTVKELDCSDFDRIGAAIPGLTDPESGTWIYAPFSGIRDFPIGRILSSRYGGVPVAVDNDVNACALAEKMYGKCRDVDHFLWMTVSNGIGGGLILDGIPYRGHFGNAAEIGHFGIADAFPCGCGNVGCLEAEAAGPGIVRRYRKLKGDDVPVSARDVVEKARAGDMIAREVVETTGSLIGKALSYVVNLLNLQMIVLGGGVMESFEEFYPSMQKTFQAHLFRGANPSVRIEKSALGYNAALVGAASLTLR